LERVLLVTNGSARLTSVREVQIGQTTYTTNNNGTLTVVARLADQRLAAGGATGTLAVSNQTLRLTNQIVLPNGSTQSGAWSATTTTDGTATFALTNLAGVHGVCRLAAWLDGGIANSMLDRDQDAWATHSYALGTTVELTASPDVGDDKNSAASKRARIRVTRTGPTNSSLVVNLTIHGNIVFRPTDTTADSQAYAINEITGSTQPKVAGYGTYGTWGGTNVTWSSSSGAYWPLPGLAFTPLENLIYAGISTDPLYAVGPMGSNARVTRLSGTDFNLPHLAVSPSAAYGIVSNASVIVGSSKNHSTGNLRPVAWEGSGTTYTAKDVGGSLAATWAGEAYGANLENQVVGQFYVLYTGGWSGAAAFRSKSGTTVQHLAFNSATGVGDILYAPGVSGTGNLTAQTVAAWITTIKNTH